MWCLSNSLFRCWSRCCSARGAGVVINARPGMALAWLSALWPALTLSFGALRVSARPRPISSTPSARRSKPKLDLPWRMRLALVLLPTIARVRRSKPWTACAGFLRACAATYCRGWPTWSALILLCAYLLMTGCASFSTPAPAPGEPAPPSLATLSSCDAWTDPTGPTGKEIIAAWIVNATYYRACATRVECARAALDPNAEACRQ